MTPVIASAATVSTLFGSTIPATPDAPDDTQAVELGVKFKASANGQITGVRFYRGYENPAGYKVSLWTTGGALLATASLPAQSPWSPGWRQATFAAPVNITAGTTYVASYFTSGGRYAHLDNGLTNQVTSGTLTALGAASSGGNGAYTYSPASAFPNNTWQASNYYVDVMYVASASGVATNGVCGPANGVAVSTAPTTNLCSTGVASAVTGAGPWGWSCGGSGGGGNASCSAPLATATGKCPIASSVSDGCPAASAGAPQLPNLFSKPFSPHTTAYAGRPPWNVAGVDFHVGYDSTLILKDPTNAGNLPGGITVNNTTHMATVTVNNTTVRGFNFCETAYGPIGLSVKANVTGTVITQNKFCAGNYPNNGGTMILSGGTSDLTITYNELDGKAYTHAGSGFGFESAFEMTSIGKVLFEYNFVHDVDAKAVRLDGTYSATCACITYKYNLTYNIGMNSGNTGDHSEDMFNYGIGFYNGRTIQFNTSITQMWSAWLTTPLGGANTANYNIGDTASNMFHSPNGDINNNVITNNVLINPGNNPGANTGPAAYNFQIGCNGGTCDNNVIADNYVDWSGGYYAWFPFFGTITFSQVSGNTSLLSGRACNPTSWTITGGGKGSGACN